VIRGTFRGEDGVQGQLSLLKDVAARLESAGIAYMVSGSTALDWDHVRRWSAELGLEELVNEVAP
jgi:hypothetical protein